MWTRAGHDEDGDGDGDGDGKQGRRTARVANTI